MDDVHIPASTSTKVFGPGRGPTDTEGRWAHTPEVRVFRHTPGRVELQIRARGPTTDSGRGAEKRTYSHAALDVDQLDTLIAALMQGRIEAAKQCIHGPPPHPTITIDLNGGIVESVDVPRCMADAEVVVRDYDPGDADESTIEEDETGRRYATNAVEVVCEAEGVGLT